MKTAFVFFSLVIAATASVSSYARTPNQQAAVEGTTFVGMTIAGTVAAGPIGFIAGALGGAFLADQSRRANQAEITLKEADKAQEQLQHALQQKEDDLNRLEELAAQRMTFQVLFATGTDTLNELDKQRIKALAEHLHSNPELTVSLDGHADPRGTDEYNNVLSQERAKAIKDALEKLGVASERIRYSGHGNRYSTAGKGNEEAYQLERRVDITIEQPAAVYSSI